MTAALSENVAGSSLSRIGAGSQERSPSPVRGYASGNEDYLARLRKIEGQVRGLQRMIEDDRWCPDIVIQVSSVTRGLQEVAVGLLNGHIQNCVLEAARSSDGGATAALSEVASTIRQVVRL
jgi:CsoR family transcriptional regulator, copper-sensing transcriptional repressor